MAGALIGGAVLGDAVSKSTSLIIRVINKTWYFESKLKEMKDSVGTMSSKVKEIEKLYEQLDRSKETDRFIGLLDQADELVLKCEKIYWSFWKKPYYDSKLDEMNRLLKDYVQSDLQLQMARNGVETLVELKTLKEGLEKGRSSGLSSAVPQEKCVTIGFDDRLRDLKVKVLKDSPDGDCSVVVVAGVGGSGKTTLVTKLCHDPEIKEKFKGNIYYAIIPEKYDIKVIIKKLLERNQVCDFDSDEAAIQQWGSFLGEKKVLLVLDDVRSASIIKHLKFKSQGYKILVTSREAFNEFDPYHLPLLNDQDATNLFRRSSFSENVNEHSNIPDDLIRKLVECCNNHPLTLSVIGGSLKEKPVSSWKLMLKMLSRGNKSFSSLDKAIQECLKKSFYLFDEEPKIKQCYQDLGLFPEDQKIPATALLDIWAHLYKHDEEGLATMDILTTLSFRNLATKLPKRKNLQAIANHCEEEFVAQHDTMRELAIHLSNEGSVEHRERLILNTYGQDLLQSTQIVNARVLSISTDENFPLTWNEVQFPKVEVFVLNFMSKMHPLPQFTHNMERLKVLSITNYGYYFSEIQNFPAPQYLSGLTKIRLDHVSVSSVSTTILMLENLQKLSLIMCKIGNSFNEGIPNKLTNLMEIVIDSCDDLVTFPAALCNAVSLKKLSITNCHELTSLSEEIGKLTNLEVLRLASCSKLTSLPESVRNLKKLRIIDLSHCLSLQELPLHIGELDSLETIDVTACCGLQELPKSIEVFDKIEVVCNEETSHKCDGFKNVEVIVVEEDALDTFYKIIT